MYNNAVQTSRYVYTFLKFTSIINSPKFVSKLECGPKPNVMAVRPNIGGALCSTPQTLADAHYYSAV